jgi:hypothetical protein
MIAKKQGGQKREVKSAKPKEERKSASAKGSTRDRKSASLKTKKANAHLWYEHLFLQGCAHFNISMWTFQDTTVTQILY